MQATVTDTLALPAMLELLERNVEAEIDNQRVLQELLDHQLEILLQGGTDRLAGILASVERGIEESRRLDRERGEFLQQVARALGMEPGTLTLSGIAGLVEQGGEEWVSRAAELRSVVIRIQDTNRKVSLLLRHSVVFLEELIGALFGRSAEASSTYDDRGRYRPKSAGTLEAEC